MALTQYTADTDIIETLGTKPEDRPTLTDNTFKAKFDENSANIKTFLNAMIAELASTAAGKGASQIGIEDSGSKFTATTVEAALAESATLISTHVADLTTDSDGVHGLKIELGTFTPTIAGSTTAGSHTYSVQTGYYQKIGNTVIAHLFIQMSAKDASMAGNVRVAGLPFVGKTGAYRYNSCTISKFRAFTFTGSPAAFLSDGANYIDIVVNTSGSGDTNLASSAVVALTGIAITAVYQTN